MISRKERVINTLIENDAIFITNCGYVLEASNEELKEFGLTVEEIEQLRADESF